ncbi:ATP-binding cassette sub-family G member 1 [Chelonus insularis]|uniref:ATP-binding cassette sub-family G member 1 n=1 Tax=Chelonus insularis TaxID=460826 RepID=UPI00158BFF95|nr:ATP-binding cassette sub-family G member 1 [Chelonus insularis]
MYQRSVLINLPKAQSINIEFHNLTYEVKPGIWQSKKLLLKGISGCFKSGELTAIMGPSGAGKSTLLNLLTGFQSGNIKGTIDYTSDEAGKQGWSVYKKAACYIQQDDRLASLFTTLETMTIAANLKLGSCLSKKAKEMLVDDILETLDLTKAKDTRCNKLSGGQKKRLSIALELIDNPPVMFLDEPTTGLDSSSTLQCVAMLHSLAKDGRTIVCTIHQPSAAIYEMFDHVYLLADGRCVYQGAPMNTISFFSNVGLQCPKYHNPADFMIEVVNKEYGNFNEQLAIAAAGPRSWRSAPALKPSVYVSGIINRSANDKKATVLISPPSEFERFWILLKRCNMQLYRDWSMVYLKFAINFSVAILLGLVFKDAGSDGSKTMNNLGYLTITAVYYVYTYTLPAILKYPSELPVLKKEKFNNWYHLRTYYIAFLIANIPIYILDPAVNTSIAYLMTNQPLDWYRFLMFGLTGMVIILVAESIGLLLGTMFNPINGTFIGSIITCAMLLFAGFLVLLRHMSFVMYSISYLSYLRYSLEALVQVVYGFNREKLPCPDNIIYCHYRMPSMILNEFNLTEDRFWFDICILLSYFVIFRFIGYFTLKRKLSRA